MYKYLPFITLDSVIKVNKKHYPQTLWEEWKYETKKIKMENLISDDLDPISANESYNETDSDESND